MCLPYQYQVLSSPLHPWRRPQLGSRVRYECMFGSRVSHQHVWIQSILSTCLDPEYPINMFGSRVCCQHFGSESTPPLDHWQKNLKHMKMRSSTLSLCTEFCYCLNGILLFCFLQSVELSEATAYTENIHTAIEDAAWAPRTEISRYTYWGPWASSQPHPCPVAMEMFKLARHSHALFVGFCVPINHILTNLPHPVAAAVFYTFCGVSILLCKSLFGQGSVHDQKWIPVVLPFLPSLPHFLLTLGTVIITNLLLHS